MAKQARGPANTSVSSSGLPELAPPPGEQVDHAAANVDRPLALVGLRLGISPAV